MDKYSVEQMVEKELEEISKTDSAVDFTKQLVKFLSRMHPSDAYVVIKEKLTLDNDEKIKSCKKLDIETYQMWQDLNLTCKRSHAHDNAPATNLDVDKALSKVYGIAMRTLRANMDMEKERFNKLVSAINKIEEHLGIDVTDFKEDNGNDTSEYEDAQDVKGTPNDVGELG